MDTSGISQTFRAAAARLAASGEDPRSQQLAENLASVHERVDRAMAAADRRDRPTLIVVTKHFPAPDVQRLHRLGVRDVGENRDQEAAGKAAEVQEALRWHFIGQLQSNKARSVLRYADHLHSVDRPSLLKALIKALPSPPEKPLTCLIQVDLRDPMPADGRGGAAPEDIERLAESIEAAAGLRLGGLMAVAPLGSPQVRHSNGCSSSPRSCATASPMRT